MPGKYIILICVLTGCLAGIGVYVLVQNSGMVSWGPAPLALPTPPAGAAWTSARGDAALTGVAPPVSARRWRVAWVFRAGSQVKSCPVVAHGRVYFGSDDGYLYCVNFARGKLIWKFDTEDLVTAAPLIRGDRVYVGSNNGGFYCLKGDSGAPVWRHDAGDQIGAAANVIDGPDGALLLLPTVNGQLQAVETAGHLAWKFQIEDYFNATPSVADGRIAIGGCDNKLHLLSASDGTQIHTVEGDAMFAASPAVVAGRAYLGDYDGTFYCVDVHSGRILWRREDEQRTFEAAAAVADGRVVAAGLDKSVSCMRAADGEPLWKFRVRDAIYTPPVIAGGTVFVGSDDGRLYALSLADGSKVWSYDLGSAVTAGPAVAGGWLLVACADGNVFCFAPEQAP